MGKGNTAGYILDPLIHSIEDVLDIERNALKAWKEGRLITKWSGNGTEVEKEIVASPGEILAECRRFKKLYAPDVYGNIVRQSSVLRTG